VRLLVDANLSHTVAEFLREAGHDAVHVRELGLQHASDSEILQAATMGERVIISENTDFGALLAHRQLSYPSFVLLRSVEPLTPQQQAMLLTANLPTVEKDLNDGAIAVLDRRRLRVRPLPIDRTDT
jgi:predicted nuclease of predicted toxin-antitoxin system